MKTGLLDGWMVGLMVKHLSFFPSIHEFINPQIQNNYTGFGGCRE